MANFESRQSINGLQNTTLFTAPASGQYFVNVQLSLPQIVTAGAASQVVAVVKKNNSSTLYTGASGDLGVQMNTITLVPGDYINIILSSNAAIDQTLNVVTGQAVSGNTF